MYINEDKWHYMYSSKLFNVLANSSFGFLVITERKKFVHSSSSFPHGTKFGKVLIRFRFTRKFGMMRPCEQEIKSRVLLSSDSSYTLQNFSQVILFAIFNPLQNVHSFQPGKILRYRRGLENLKLHFRARIIRIIK